MTLNGSVNIMCENALPTNVSTNQDVCVVLRDVGLLDLYVTPAIGASRFQLGGREHESANHCAPHCGVLGRKIARLRRDLVGYRPRGSVAVRRPARAALPDVCGCGLVCNDRGGVAPHPFGSAEASTAGPACSGYRS